jgi:hypothetical protein
MDRLSSCYFCGTALDEPLQDYPLVAGETGSHGAVVTLCPGCHHKLETVLDVVVDGEDLPALEDTARTALEGESPAALTEPDEGEPAADPIALGDGEQGNGETGNSAENTDGEGADDTTGGTDAATPGGSEQTTAGDDATTAGDTADERGGTDPDREVTGGVSALEYNKVMRLLQNREFPVDRAEIEAVATSAYELSASECAAVIDTAVDRGLVAEQDGALVRPDG